MGTEPRVILSPRKAGAAIGGHPWVYKGAIGRMDGTVEDGDAVAVFGGDDGRFIAYGLYNSKSDIRIRLYSWDRDAPLTAECFESKIRSAVSLRRELLGFDSPQGACRLVFSEADGFSGLVVDRYADCLIVQLTSLALAMRFEEISSALRKVAEPRGIFLRGVKDLAQKEGLEIEDRLWWGELPKGPVGFEQDGVRFEVEIGGGQKTGFYLDQRENRLAVAKLAPGKRVLDLHTYTGGFSLHCAKAGAREVIGVDSSRTAIERARRHAEINQISSVRFVEEDVFAFLRGYKGEPFDLVVLDPPRLAPTEGVKKRALRMYHRLNTDALKVVRPGGILATCSCSGAIENHEWLALLGSVARRSNRLLQVLEVRGASRDHPFSIHCPESRYLKCVIGKIS